jgi:NADH-quinone oxidoreductase subunit J
MFFVLGAPLVATLVVIVNAGAIMVLFVFIVMMLNIGPQTADRERFWLRPRTWIGPGLLGLILAVELAYVFIEHQTGRAAGQVVGPREVGIAMFGPYLLGAELASMLLLAGLLGAYHLGQGVLQSKEEAS